MAKELIGPPPPPPCLAAAPVTYSDIEKIRDQRLLFALAEWAQKKMGKNRGAYIERAKRHFSTLFGMLWLLLPENEKTSARLLDLVQQVPFNVPLKISDKQPIPENLVDIHNHYMKALKTIEQWKKRKGSATERTLALMGILPGIEWLDAWKWRQKKASIIAYNYIARNYGLLSGDTAKKKVSLVTQPEKFVREMVKNIAREAGIKIPSSPPKNAKS